MSEQPRKQHRPSPAFRKQITTLILIIAPTFFTHTTSLADEVTPKEQKENKYHNLCEVIEEHQTKMTAKGIDESNYKLQLPLTKKQCDENNADTPPSSVTDESFIGKSSPELDPLDKSFLSSLKDFAQTISEYLGYTQETYDKIDNMLTQGWTVFDLQFVKGIVEDSMNICESLTPTGDPYETDPPTACADSFPQIIDSYQEVLDKHESFDLKEITIANTQLTEAAHQLTEEGLSYSSNDKKFQPMDYDYLDYDCNNNIISIPEPSITTKITVVCDRKYNGTLWTGYCHEETIMTNTGTNYGDNPNRNCHRNKISPTLFKRDTVEARRSMKAQSQITKTRDFYKYKRLPMHAASRVRLAKHLENTGDSDRAAANYIHAAVLYELYKAIPSEQAARIYLNIAASLAQAGNEQQAEKYIEKADDASTLTPPADPAFAAETFLIIGKHAMDKGENMKAKNRFESAEAAICKGYIETTPDNCLALPVTAETFDNLAAVYEIMDKPEQTETARQNAQAIRQQLAAPESGDQ